MLPADARHRPCPRIDPGAPDARADCAACCRDPSCCLSPDRYRRASRHARWVHARPRACLRPKPRRAASIPIPAGRVLSRRAAIDRFPRLHGGLTGAAIWHDYVTPESDRLTFTWAAAAAEHGAAVGELRRGARAAPRRPASCRRSRGESPDGREVEISARVTVNATGGAVDRLLMRLAGSTGIPLWKAMNLVTRREGGEAALGGRSASGRHLFLVPWRTGHFRHVGVGASVRRPERTRRRPRLPPSSPRSTRRFRRWTSRGTT